jgi:Holliday junction DNA helicase RuvA
MIDMLEGFVWRASPTFVTINVNGVGYGLNVTVPTGAKCLECAEGQKLVFLTHLQIREDAWDFFGFLSAGERDVFRALIGVTGIGAKTAQRMLSECPPSQLLAFIAESNVTALTKIKGIGQKTAEMLIVQLKSVAQKLHISPETAESSINSEALLALIALGLKEAIAQKALEKAQKVLGQNPTTAALITEALRYS